MMKIVENLRTQDVEMSSETKETSCVHQLNRSFKTGKPERFTCYIGFNTTFNISHNWKINSSHLYYTPQRNSDA